MKLNYGMCKALRVVGCHEAPLNATVTASRWKTFVVLMNWSRQKKHQGCAVIKKRSFLMDQSSISLHRWFTIAVRSQNLIFQQNNLKPGVFAERHQISEISNLPNKQHEWKVQVFTAALQEMRVNVYFYIFYLLSFIKFISSVVVFTSMTAPLIFSLYEKSILSG